MSALFPTSSARLALLLALAVAGAAWLAFDRADASSPCSSTPLAPSCFEAHDGDLVSGAGRLDWANVESSASSDPSVPYEVTLPDATGASDDVFGPSSVKENAEPSSWTFTAGAQAKSDIRRGVFARDVVPNAAGRPDVFVYAALERVGTTGSANLSIELNRNSPVSQGGKLVPSRSDDDLLVVFDGQLSGAATIGFCKWKVAGPSVTSGWYRIDANGNATADKLGGSTDCTSIADLTGKPNVASGSVGVGSLANPGYLQGFSDPVAAATFAEVGVNLTELLNSSASNARCFSYGAVFMHSRASDSGTADMQDYVAPKAIPATGSCAVSAEKTVSKSAAGPFTQNLSAAPGDTLNYRVTATNSGTVPLTVTGLTDTATFDPNPSTVGGESTVNPGCDGLVVGSPAGKIQADGAADGSPASFDPGDRWTWTCSKSGAPFAIGGSYANSVVVNATAPGPGAGTIPVASQPSVSTATFPDASATSLSVAKTVSGAAAGPFAPTLADASPSGSLFFRIAVTNTGSDDLTVTGISDRGLTDPDAGGPNQGTTRDPGCAGLTDGGGSLVAPATKSQAGGAADATSSTFDSGDVWTWTCSQSAAAGGFGFLGTYANTATAAATPIGGGLPVFSTPSSAVASFRAAPTTSGSGDGTGGGSTTSSSSALPAKVTTTNVSSQQGQFERQPSKACVTKRFDLHIVGRSIAKVTFLVDGKVKKVVTRPDSRGRWSFLVNPSLKDTVRHRVQVRIEHTAASGLRPKTLSHVYQRCACASRRNFKIRVASKRKDPVVRASVYVNGKRVKVVRGRRLTAPVKLTGLPKGRFTVKIVATTRSGKRQVGERQYRTCTKKSAAKTKPNL